MLNSRQFQFPGSQNSRQFPGGFPPGPPGQQQGTGGFPPGPPPGQSGQQAGSFPPGPPPTYVPQASPAFTSGQAGTFAVDPGAIRPCLFRYVYIWQNNGQGFWAWLTFAGFRSIAGFRWNGFRWNYFGMDTNRISSFVCT
ncbi:transporter [Fictibacillus fluitans]|uniref:Transporter n=1 Tax=Fictibacillus fluitans TaxID=3058422 RepID=A0ABT8HSM9_9BACL|nr:transporter [Fictibacillus sp. NE201]MDN4523766.1 transporter [Fictibacillus sp. NE201]